jgi:hypothetical protein
VKEKTSGFDCPSAQPDMADARVFGLIGGTEDSPRVAYLKPGVRVPSGILERLGKLSPMHVFRFAGTCEESRCTHFDGSRCQLGNRIATMLPPVVDALPACQIRANCRWFAEQGGAVCLRCPQIVTSVPKTDDVLCRVASSQASENQ